MFPVSRSDYYKTIFFIIFSLHTFLKIAKFLGAKISEFVQHGEGEIESSSNLSNGSWLGTAIGKFLDIHEEQIY